MGNCQAIDAATLVIQHPNGKVENLCWPISASEVMKMNPGHYVALLLSTTLYPPNNNNTTTTNNNKNNNSSSNNINSSINGGECPKNSTNTTTTTTTTNNGSLRVTRIKLLRPTDTLTLGHCYRLITTQEVMKGLRAKKQAKKGEQQESTQKPEKVKQRNGSGLVTEAGRSELQKKNQVTRNERNSRPRTATTTSSNNLAVAAGRPRTWQPSLHSILEAGSSSK